MSTGDPNPYPSVDDEASTGPVHHSVFQAVDQRSMLERLDAMEDEELSDGFFDRDFVSASAAATNSLEVGLKTLVGGTPAVQDAGEGSVRSSVPGIPDDPSSHRAFVLGGPARIGA